MGFEVKVQQPLASCPVPAPEIQKLSLDAQAAWQACTSPLRLTQVSIQTSAEDFGDLVAVLEILGDTEAISGGKGFFLGPPAMSQPELLHGPSHAEYKNLHNHTFDGHFPLVCALVVLLSVA